MKSSNAPILLTLAWAWPWLAAAQQVQPDLEPCHLFAGAGRRIPLVWHNADDRAVTNDVRLRLYQTSSTTAAPLVERFWKRLTVLPGQIVLETASLELPAV